MELALEQEGAELPLHLPTWGLGVEVRLEDTSPSELWARSQRQRIPWELAEEEVQTLEEMAAPVTTPSSCATPSLTPQRVGLEGRGRREVPLLLCELVVPVWLAPEATSSRQALQDSLGLGCLVFSVHLGLVALVHSVEEARHWQLMDQATTA